MTYNDLNIWFDSNTDDDDWSDIVTLKQAISSSDTRRTITSFIDNQGFRGGGRTFFDDRIDGRVQERQLAEFQAEQSAILQEVRNAATQSDLEALGGRTEIRKEFGQDVLDEIDERASELDTLADVARERAITQIQSATDRDELEDMLAGVSDIPNLTNADRAEIRRVAGQQEFE